MQLEGPHRRRRVERPETPEEPTPVESSAEPVQEPEKASEVPEKVTDVKAWVGDDKDKAQEALEVERAKPESEQRPTLVSWLEEVLRPDEDLL
jgi:hypothetical protein